ncbi:MAG: hypothetical protein ACXVLQ_10770 [Bacteriovorax sp.]
MKKTLLTTLFLTAHLTLQTANASTVHIEWTSPVGPFVATLGREVEGIEAAFKEKINELCLGKGGFFSDLKITISGGGSIQDESDPMKIGVPRSNFSADVRCFE